MRAGLIQQPIDIYKPYVEKNEFGEQVTVYKKEIHTRARIIYDDGERVNMDGDMTYVYTLTFEVRRYHKISEYDHVHYTDKKFRILSIEHNKAEQKQVIKCQLINE